MKKFTSMSLLILIATAGCQQETSTKKTTGSYSATRHHQIGSHVPQPYDAESAAQAYDPERFANTPNQQSSVNGGAFSSAGGGGGR